MHTAGRVERWARLMQVRIDADKCQGHSMCVMSAPDVFDLADDGVATLLQTPHTDDEREVVHRAALSCPEQAISCDDDAAS